MLNECKHANIVIMYIKIKVDILVSVVFFFFSPCRQTAFNPKRCIQGDFSNDRWKITKREKGLSVMAASLDAGLSEEEISFSASVKEDNKNLLLRHS